MFDTHNHCEFSCDADQTLPQAIAAAQKLGIGFCLTEHWDYEYPTNPEQFLFDREAYFAKNAQYRTDTVLLGIEIGMQPHLAAREDAVPNGYPFDYVIGSIHIVDRVDIYEPYFYTGKEKGDVVAAYLRDMLACIESHHNFDALGHIDYICRYWPYADKHLHYREHAAAWDAVFRALVARDMPIEINTRRLLDAAAISPLQELYNRYAALGGKYCTIGSDAHHTAHVGRGLDVAARMAREAGLTPVYFKERKRYVDEV